MAWWRRKQKKSPDSNGPDRESPGAEDPHFLDDSSPRDVGVPEGFVVVDEDAARPANDPTRSPFWRDSHPENRFRSFTHLKREDLWRIPEKISDARLDLQLLLHIALESDVQSINFEPSADNFRVRMRSGREWETVLEGDRKRFDAIAAELGRMLMNDPEFLLTSIFPQTEVINIDYPDGDWKVAVCESLPGIDGPIIHVYFQSSGEKGFILDIDKLGIREPDLVKIKRALDQTRGLVVIAGPTGAGKSVLCYSALVRAQMQGRSVATVERPKKFLLPDAVQVGLHGYKTYVDGMAAVLEKYDPDVIMLQEADGMMGLLPLLEEAKNRLIIVGYHSYNALRMLQNLLMAVYEKGHPRQGYKLGTDEYAPARAMVERLLLVTGSRLLPANCFHCRKSRPLAPEALEKAGMNPEPGHLYHHYVTLGCNACGHTGFTGKEPIFEVMPVTPAILDACEAWLQAADESGDPAASEEINRAHDDARANLAETARREGMRPMRLVALDKVLEGGIRLNSTLVETPELD